MKIKGNEKYEFYSIQLQCHSTSHSTQPNPTYGWTEPMSISDLAVQSKHSFSRSTNVCSALAATARMRHMSPLILYYTALLYIIVVIRVARSVATCSTTTKHGEQQHSSADLRPRCIQCPLETATTRTAHWK